MEAKAINRLLELRIKDLAARTAAKSREDHRQRVQTDRDRLLKCLGLYPLPPRTQLEPKITGILQFPGYRLEKIAYRSRPGVPVTAHLYLPEGNGPFPVVLNPHGHWEFKKSSQVVQARGISLALQGFAALVVDSPGVSWDGNEQNERAGMGPHDDPFLCMGAPATGVYVWDLMRGLDYLETRPDVDAKRVGITGASGGGTAAMYAFAIDERISAAVPVCSAASMEDMPHNGCLCNHVPGVANLGDRSDILGLRAPAPLMLIGAAEDPEFPIEGMRRTYEKLKSIYKPYREEGKVRLELFEGKHDYNRRMREAMLAFFREHLMGERARPYVPESRPLTDGAEVPFEANTLPPQSPELQVLDWSERSGRTFRDLLMEALVEPYPEKIAESERLVRWGRFGRVGALEPRPNLRLADEARTQEPDWVILPWQEIDLRSCIYLGLSVPEVLAQLVHLLLPGGPEGWESVALSGDVVTSMIASMKTLVGSAHPETAPKSVVAEGPVSSMCAMFLKLLRPDLETKTSHSWKGWIDVANSGMPALVQPGARYLQWPW